MTLDTPRNRKFLFFMLNFPLTLILLAAFNSLAAYILRPEPSLQVLIATYLFLTVIVDIFLLGVFRMRTLRMMLFVIMEVILVYALFFYLFFRSR